MSKTTEPDILFRVHDHQHPDGHQHIAPPGITIYHSHPYDAEHWHPTTDCTPNGRSGRHPGKWPARPPQQDESDRYAQRLFGGMVRRRMMAGGHPFP